MAEVCADRIAVLAEWPGGPGRKMMNIDALRPTHISQLSAADHHEAQMMVQSAEREVLSRNEMPSADSHSVLQTLQLRHRPKSGVAADRYSKSVVLIESNRLNRTGDAVGKDCRDADEFVGLVEKGRE